MSGHSHFKTVKATKDANDAKKGKIFSKLALVITLAVKEKGADSTTNARLKSAIEKAKEFNMPKENIERAIKKGTGELAGEQLQEVSFEGFGPGGIAVIIDGITDNKNRTLGEVKGILSQHDGKMAGEGAVRWMFERRGLVTISIEGKIKEELEKIKKILEEKNLKIESASLQWVPKEEIAITDKEKEKAQKLFDALDEN